MDTPEPTISRNLWNLSNLHVGIIHLSDEKNTIKYVRLFAEQKEFNPD
jgi:hypothetical protein